MKIFLRKIHSTENIPFIIGIGKIYLNLKTKMIGLVFVLIENIGDQKKEINQITLGI